MNKQPYNRTAFCGCGVQFQARDRWQRSCEKCLEARAAAEAARGPKACHRCGSRQDVSSRLCAACRAVKQAKRAAEGARSEQRRWERFGPCPQHPHHPVTHDGVCFECHHAKVKERRKQELRQRLADEAAEKEERELAARYARMDDTQKALVNYMMLMGGGSVPEWLTRAPDVAEPVNPEQVSADDQDAIDDAFRGLMDGFDPE